MVEIEIQGGLQAKRRALVGILRERLKGLEAYEDTLERFKSVPPLLALDAGKGLLVIGQEMMKRCQECEDLNNAVNLVLEFEEFSAYWYSAMNWLGASVLDDYKHALAEVDTVTNIGKGHDARLVMEFICEDLPEIYQYLLTSLAERIIAFAQAIQNNQEAIVGGKA